ncbi:MAG: TetR/AcrR family transcriptional regulator [Pseudomonadota bacterium]
MATAANTSTNTAPKRRVQERTEITKLKLLSAAIKEFTERGFDAVTNREIEVRAKVQRGLVRYHFGEKANLWKAAGQHLMEKWAKYRDQRAEIAVDLPPKERLALRIRSFVRFSANNPALNRLMMLEGMHKSWRTSYLVENFQLDNVADLKSLVSQIAPISEENFFHWYYVFIGGCASIFCLTPEAKHLFGVDVTDDEIIRRHGQVMVDALLNLAESPPDAQ